MQPFEAVNILDSATANMKGSRQDHVTILQAVQTLRMLHPNPVVGNEKTAVVPEPSGDKNESAPVGNA